MLIYFKTRKDLRKLAKSGKPIDRKTPEKRWALQLIPK